MRITSGTLRGRPIEPPKDRQVRPTSDKLRQAIFNILTSRDAVGGAYVMDLCCGTGALGFEALSRGCEDVVLIDQHPTSLALAKQNAKSLGVEGQCSFFKADCRKLPERPAHIAPRSLVFFDPPYKQELITPGLLGLISQNWLADGAYVVCETEKGSPFIVPEGYRLELERTYGDSEIKIIAR